ncbi:hypothetical protein F5141DRAFT_1296170 [Pisolithus sp. B1]|nr:hypothetical protein F5141DRAFT_1296170 [Pisolithus sp. B1]
MAKSRLIQDLAGSTGPSRLVTPLAWSSDGLQLFVASKGKITCFNVSKSSSSEWSIHQTQSQSRVSIASNGRFIACSAGSSVSLWDCVSHKRIGNIITHTAEIRSITLSPSGGYLACGLKGRIIITHNLRDILPPEYFDYGFPLVRVSDEVLKSWTQDDQTNTEMLLSEEIARALTPNHYVLANRALIRARLKLVALAIEDANQSLQVQPSPIGSIAMAVALLGQGDRGGALCAFDLAFHDCELHDHRILLLLKSILVFESGNEEEAIMRVEHLAARVNNTKDGVATYLYTQVLGVMYMKKEWYGRAIPLIERAKNLAPKDKRCPHLMMISLIFGWSFNVLDIDAQQRLCETLFAKERTAEAVEVLLNVIGKSDEEIQRSNVTAGWIAGTSLFTQRCAMTLMRVGDEAFASAKHDDAITQYSVALSLSPSTPAGFFFKRSRARAAKRLWEDALQDAIEAVKTDPSDPWGYEAKHAALHGAERYDEAIDAFKSMLHAIEHSHYPAIRQLRKNYLSPSETIAAVNPIVRRILEGCPLVVIDVETGRLCDGPERMRIFKAGLTFKELISSMTGELDNERVLRVAAKFFGYTMFSHVWQGNEPSFQDVKVVESVWKLPDTPLSEKLRNFCKETRKLGYNWAWSDTCCIDKTTSSVLDQTLTSMYKWYADSAATLVFLVGVAHPSKLGDLTRSPWMTRAWTLQELLAPKVILFYDFEWKPYLGNTSTNHKESMEIMQELAEAIKIPRGTIVAFSPANLGVREKLRLASTRSVTVEEDVAYSLIGIFKSGIKPHYTEGADALGHLLEEIVARTGEVTVLAWSGKSSSYNSCLPASLSVYNQTSYSPPSLGGQEMETCTTELRRRLLPQVALDIYERINSLQPARFATCRLHLPCIVFPVERLGIRETYEGNEKLYRARVSDIGNVDFTTVDHLLLNQPQKLVLVHPWIHHIRGSSSGVTWGGDSELDTDSALGSDHGAGSDEVSPPLPLHAIPAPQIDDYTRGLQMIARLGQPFNALLLAQQPNGEYKRVAAENDIVVSGLRTNITSKSIRVKVLEIL